MSQHLGDAEIGMKIVVMAAQEPRKLLAHLRRATDLELIGLAAHIVTLEGCVEDVRQVFGREVARRETGR